MYRKEIEEYIDSHKDQMIEDICTLCRINSEKMPYTEGKPFGEGPFEVLQTARSRPFRQLLAWQRAMVFLSAIMTIM